MMDERIVSLSGGPYDGLRVAVVERCVELAFERPLTPAIYGDTADPAVFRFQPERAE